MDTPDFNELFVRAVTLPDSDAQRRLSRLVGIDDVKQHLTKLLSTLINPDALQTWARRHHPEARYLVEQVATRPPLVVLAGDVGTGKTALAETIGDAVARAEDVTITLLPLSLNTRGSGKVGEMSRLLSAAFDETFAMAKKLRRERGRSGGAVILLVDEADALTQSRESSQMHHEDRVGVNAFIRGVDRLAGQRLPVAVILCTNRLSEIDPAVRRRAAALFSFERPNSEQRRAVIGSALGDVGFTDREITELVELTGPIRGREHGWTYSDLTQRLLPALVLDAYPDRALTFARARQVIEQLQPTPPFLQSKATP